MDSNNNSANMKLSPGMMCLVIGFRSSPINLGKVVVLEKTMQDGDRTPSGSIFFPPSSSGNVWLVSGEGLHKCVKGINGDSFQPSSYAFKSEGHLMPIRPEEDPLEMSMQSIEDYLDSKQEEKA